jgi:hypothetical protein
MNKGTDHVTPNGARHLLLLFSISSGLQLTGFAPPGGPESTSEVQVFSMTGTAFSPARWATSQCDDAESAPGLLEAKWYYP